jgi:hypothetical protein
MPGVILEKRPRRQAVPRVWRVVAPSSPSEANAREHHICATRASTVRGMEAAAGGPDPDWFRRHVELHGEAKRTAYDEVNAHARGRPVDEVRLELERALRARDVWVPPEVLDRTARAMAGPWWPLRHPVQFLREKRTLRCRSEGDSEDEDSEIATTDRIWEALEDRGWRPRRSFEVRFIRAHRTFDGSAYTVAIEPWSEPAAETVRRLCAPTDVTVIEHKADGR